MSELSDNWLFDVMARGDQALRHALAIAFIHNDHPATHYEVIQHAQCSNGWRAGLGSVATLILHAAEPSINHSGERTAFKLPYPLHEANVTEFVQNWLASVTYPTQPDHDGDNAKGWRVFCEAWGHVAGRREAILAVQPCWAMLGK